MGGPRQGGTDRGQAPRNRWPRSRSGGASDIDAAARAARVAFIPCSSSLMIAVWTSRGTGPRFLRLRSGNFGIAPGGQSYTAEELAPGRSRLVHQPRLRQPVAPRRAASGEVVLDLGSGGGLDVLLSARRVAPGGHAYGVDMTDEMLALANQNKEKARVENATFLTGTIENVPLPDDAVDVVISNCVINLAEDKNAVIREAFRVLKPGGRFSVSDMVELRALPPVVKEKLDAWARCIAGTIPVEDYRQILIAAGFEAPEIEITGEQGVAGLPGAIGSASIRARKPGPVAEQ